MKKRILSAVLAAVLSVSALSIVSFADDAVTTTAAEEAVKAIKTKEDLTEFIKSFTDKFLYETLYTYGQTSTLNFQNAYNNAVYVRDYGTQTYEFNDAYYLLAAANANLKQYTKAELQALINEAKPTYQNNNMLNTVTGDFIYSDSSWSAFISSYDVASNSVDSNLAVITDAYLALKAGFGGLAKLETITWAQMTAAKKAADTVWQKSTNYHANRRGTINGKTKYNDAAWSNGSNGDKIANAWNDGNGHYSVDYNFYFGKPITWGSLFNATVAGGNIWTRNDNGLGSVTLEGWEQVAIFGEEYPNFNTQYSEFEAKAFSYTSNPNIVLAYKNIMLAVDTVNKFVPDSYNTSSKVTIQNLLKSGPAHDFIVGKINAATAIPVALDKNTLSDAFNKLSANSVKYFYAGANNISAAPQLHYWEGFDVEYTLIDGYKVFVRAGINLTAAAGNTVDHYLPYGNPYNADNTVKAGENAITNLGTFTKGADDNNGTWDSSTSIYVKSISYSISSLASKVKADTNIDLLNADGSQKATTANLWIQYNTADNSFVKASTSAISSASGKSVDFYAKGAKIALNKYVVLDLNNITTIANGLGIVTTFDKDLKTALTDAINAINAPAETAKTYTAGNYGYWYRNIQYALAGAGFGASSTSYVKTTKAQLQALINDSYTTDDRTIPFLATEHKAVVNARENAIKVVKGTIAPTTASDDFVTEYKALKDAVDAFEALIAKYPVTAKAALEVLAKTYEAEESGYELSDAFIAKRNSLITQLYTNTSVYENATYINENIRLCSDKGSNEALFNVYTAYKALADAYDTLMETPAFELGDANLDGKVDTKDAVVILKHAAEVAVLEGDALKAADFNEDGKVTAADASLVLKLQVQ